MSCDLEVTNESARCWEKISSFITKKQLCYPRELFLSNVVLSKSIYMHNSWKRFTENSLGGLWSELGKQNIQAKDLFTWRGGPQVVEVTRLGQITGLSIWSLILIWSRLHDRWGDHMRDRTGGLPHLSEVRQLHLNRPLNAPLPVMVKILHLSTFHNKLTKRTTAWTG